MTQNLPAFLQNYRRGAAATPALDSLTKMATGAQPYLSIMGNRFRAIDIVGDEQMVGDIDRKTGLAYVDVVIIDANPHVSKVYYSKAYDPSAAEYSPPDCWSDNGIAPSTQASLPQARSCAECPLAVWGSSTSKLTGKQTKACNDVKKIAVFIPELAGMGAWLLRVPPASLKDLADYARKIAGNGAVVAQVVTRLSFHPEGIGMLTFNAVNWIDQNMMTAIDEIGDDKLALLVGSKDQPRTGELPPPGQAGQRQLAQTQGNGTQAPNQPPPKEELFAADKPTNAHNQTVPEETEVERLKREMAEMQAKLAAAQGGGQAATQDAPKRTRRTKAEMEAARAQQEGGAAQQSGGMFSGAGGAAAGASAPAKPETEEMQVPSFLTGGKPATIPVQRAAGGQQAEEPSADLQAALDAAFSLNM